MASAYARECSRPDMQQVVNFAMSLIWLGSTRHRLTLLLDARHDDSFGNVERPLAQSPIVSLVTPLVYLNQPKEASK